MENTETQSNQNRSDSSRMDRKIRTIRFILLSIILYIISDAIGRWFVPEQDSVPGLYTMMIWVLCFMTGALQFFWWRRINLKWLRWAVAIVYVILFVLLLKWRGFYRYGGSTLIGYKFSLTIMPLWGFLIESTFTSFLRWYGNLIKRIFKLESINNIVFLLFMLVPVAIVVMLFIGGYKLTGSLSDKGADIQQFIDEGEINHNTDRREPVRQYDRLFNDLNDTQLEAARKNGLKKPISLDEAESNRQLQKIETNRYYHVQKLTHSVPYLVPRAAKLLEDMGKAFQDSLFNRGYNRNHRITVTSVLRTEETVRQLRKTNVNSSENSCHCYGTTFDISYFTFSTPEVGKAASVDKMRQILYQVAYDMKRQNRCYVKYEKQQTCLHITVR
ncbi:MAG: hypothetical protein IKX55_08195 [Bacteroidaceae bacterium]|nr:hypothetical protein [Bacteroidaceae bacterium]